MFAWLKNRRRRRILAEPIWREWMQVLERNVGHYPYLTPAQRDRMHDVVRVFVAEKHFEGCGGQAIDDEIRVTIAAEAALLALGVEPAYYYDRVHTILVYPAAYVHPAQLQHDRLVVDEELPVYGESWHRGPVVLTWDRVLDDARHPWRGKNLVLHEFAHQLDGLNGSVDGTPPVVGSNAQRDWHRVTSAEYARLVQASLSGAATLLDQYGAGNEAEFFAVATECFFGRPRAMRRRHPQLYGVLSAFYQLDPSGWQLPATPTP